MLRDTRGYDALLRWREEYSVRVAALTAADVGDERKRRKWIHAVDERVAVGIGSHRPRHMPWFRERGVEEIFAHANARVFDLAAIATSLPKRVIGVA